MKTDSGLSAMATETQIFQMYGSDAGQPVPSLYTKGLSPLCDRTFRPEVMAGAASVQTRLACHHSAMLL